MEPNSAKLPGSPSLTKPGLFAALPGIGQRGDSGFSLPTEGHYQQSGRGVHKVSSSGLGHVGWIEWLM